VGFLLNECTFCEFSAETLAKCDDFTCCKDKDIEDYFKCDAVDNAAELLGKSYCFITPRNKIVCAFTVSNSSIKTNDIPSRKKNRLQRIIPHAKWRSQYPAVLVGQLAVFDEFAGNRIGDEMMNFIKSWFVDSNNKTGCRYIIVDAVNTPKVIEYYKRNGFDFIFSSDEEESRYSKLKKSSFAQFIRRVFKKNLHSNTERRTRLMFYDLIIIKPK
jgi:GNAT superfamily N-acetyltransferase